jgi:ferredoxin
MTEDRLVVDRILCDGSGICAELVPELVRLDDWGYPIIDGRRIDVELTEHARRAVASCPVRALRISQATHRKLTGQV